MFERFTEQARQVVVLAQEESRALEHGFIGTEHLLLGLLREEGGIAARVLNGLGLTIDGAREQVVRILGPCNVVGSSRQIPFTPRAKRVLELSLKEALALGHNYIGTEHVLLGLMTETDGIGAQIVRDADADAGAVRAAVIKTLVPEGDPHPGQPRATEAVRAAHRVEVIAAARRMVAGQSPGWREEVTAGLASITEALTRLKPSALPIPRARARRLVEDAISSHDSQARDTLGPEAWAALVTGILDANPDVEAAGP